MERLYRDPDWLEQQYHDEGLTQQEIAEECGVSPRTIRTYMNRFGIETREVKGENHGLYGKERSEETKKKISAALMNREVSATTRQLISAANRGRPTSPEVKEKISRSLSGLTRSMETRAKMSQSTAGEQNPNWRGGYSRRYGAGWAPARDRVRNRDQVCQHCGDDGANRRLEVHHIVPVRVYRDSTELPLKAAHQLDNLILLCSRCHGKADHGLINFD